MGDLTVMQKQEIAKGAQAMGAMVGRHAKNRAEKLTSPLTTLSFWGQILSVGAFIAALVFAGFMVFDASSIDVDFGRAAVVARDTVNVRQTPGTGAAVVTQAHSGDRFTITGAEGRWTRVYLSESGGSGWIASGLLDTETAKTMVLRYEMKGYFTALLICLVILFFALRMKRVGVPLTQAGPGVNPNETLLVNKE
jgi:uncharacterized protein YgiM (DUF1202 family)